MPDIQASTDAVKNAATTVASNVEASAIHAETRAVNTVSHNTKSVLIAGAVLLVVVAVLAYFAF